MFAWRPIALMGKSCSVAKGNKWWWLYCTVAVSIVYLTLFNKLASCPLTLLKGIANYSTTSLLYSCEWHKMGRSWLHYLFAHECNSPGTSLICDVANSVLEKCVVWNTWPWRKKQGPFRQRWLLRATHLGVYSPIPLFEPNQWSIRCASSSTQEQVICTGHKIKEN